MKDQVKQGLRILLDNCKEHGERRLLSKGQINQLLAELNHEQSAFKNVLDTLRQLEHIDLNIIEMLFYYRLHDNLDYEAESNRLAKEFKF